MRLRTLYALLACCLLVVAGVRVAARQAGGLQQPSQGAAAGAQMIALADEVAKEIEALRGWTFKQPVKKELNTLPETLDYLKGQVDDGMPPGRLQAVQAFLRTIGLLPPGVNLRDTWVTLLENQVGGFYDVKTKSMHLVARPGTPPVVERIVLAHELTHALDDQWVDLDAFMKAHVNDTEDMGLAAQSVVEGSATALMMHYTAGALRTGKLNLAGLQEYAKQEQERSKPFLEAPRYFSAMLASYICGAQFLAKGQMMALALAADDKAVGEALVAARRDPPQSTEQVLHPAKYWTAATRDDPVRFDDGAAAKWLERPGRWIVHRDTVGELLAAILVGKPGAGLDMLAMQSSDGWTNQAATGWGGDRFYLLASGDTPDAARESLGALKGVWLTAWDSSKDRDEFIAAIPAGSMPTGAVATSVGSAVAVVYLGLDEGERTALTERLTGGSVPMTKGGKPWSGLRP